MEPSAPGAELPPGVPRGTGTLAGPDSGELEALLALVEQARVTEPEAWPSPTPIDGQSVEQWRARTVRLRSQHDARVLEIRRLSEPVAAIRPVAETFYFTFELAGATLNSRIYVPALAGTAPCLLFLHGGGWWMAGGATGFEINDPLCRTLCDKLGAVVVNLDYRLAPEHPFPEPLEDVSGVLCWLQEHGPTRWRIDPDRIGVMGNSSGGNLAAALALLTRERGGPTLRVQLLHVPALDLTSAKVMGDDDEARATAARVRAYYAGGEADLSQPLLSPALAPDLSALPPTVLILAELDPLREEGQRYGEGLARAGVDVDVFEYPMTHTVATPAVAEGWLDDLVTAARRHL